MKTSRMEFTLQITKALADRQRVRILMLLQGRELCVCQIIAVLDLAPSTISKHLSILGAAGLVHHRKEGRWAYYRLPGDSTDSAVRGALHWVAASLRGDVAAGKDSKKLDGILRCDPEALCRQQRKC